MLRSLRFLAAPLLSGLLLAAAFPLPGWSFLAWIALVPLLLTVERRPFLSGYVCGVAFFAAALYWLNIVMVAYGHLPLALSVVAYLGLVAYLALYIAVPVWLAERFRRRFRLAPVWSLPLLWVGSEYLRGLLLTGFPWVLIGYSQSDNLPLIQSADLLGVYGIGLLLVAANILLATLLRAIWRVELQRIPWGALVLFALLLGADWGYGVWRLDSQSDQVETPLKVGLIQGDIDQAVKWNPGYQMTTVQTYLSLSAQALDAGAQLLVWPESATPFYLQDPSALSRAVQQVVGEGESYLLTGSPAYERTPVGIRYLNSAFLIAPGGEIAGRSDKVHLVPFGEYVPLGEWLPFVNKLVAGIGDFSPGSIAPVRIPGGAFGVLVCYEAIFPELARSYVGAGSELLVNITNDAWFGRSSAPYQHLAMARFRAVENRRWFVRAANTGISAIIAPSGTVVVSSPLFQTAVVSGGVGFRSEQTFYTQRGDLLPFGALLIAFAWLLRSFRKSRTAQIS